MFVPAFAYNYDVLSYVCACFCLLLWCTFPRKLHQTTCYSTCIDQITYWLMCWFTRPCYIQLAGGRSMPDSSARNIWTSYYETVSPFSLSFFSLQDFRRESQPPAGINVTSPSNRKHAIFLGPHHTTVAEWYSDSYASNQQSKQINDKGRRNRHCSCSATHVAYFCARQISWCVETATQSESELGKTPWHTKVSRKFRFVRNSRAWIGVGPSWPVNNRGGDEGRVLLWLTAAPARKHTDSAWRFFSWFPGGILWDGKTFVWPTTTILGPLWHHWPNSQGAGKPSSSTVFNQKHTRTTLKYKSLSSCNCACYAV